MAEVNTNTFMCIRLFMSDKITDVFGNQTREYEVCRYGAMLRIRGNRLDPIDRERLRDPERVSRVMARWMVRHAARHAPAAVLSSAPATVRAMTDMLTNQAAVIGYSFAIRDVHPDDRETADWWLRESPPKYHRLIVPVIRPLNQR